MIRRWGKRCLLLFLVLLCLPLAAPAIEEETAADEDRWLFLYRVPGTQIKLMLPVSMRFDVVHYDPIRIHFWMYDTAAPEVSYLFVAERFTEHGDVTLEEFGDEYYPLLGSWLLGLSEDAEIDYYEDLADGRSAIRLRDRTLDDDLQYIAAQDDWFYSLVARPDEGQLTEVQEEVLREMMAASLGADTRRLDTTVRLPLAARATYLPAHMELQVEADDAGYYYAMLSDIYTGSVLCTFIGIQEVAFMNHQSVEALPKDARDLLFSYLGADPSAYQVEDLPDFTETQSVQHYYTEGQANDTHYYIALKNGWALVCSIMERDAPHDAQRDVERSRLVFAAALAGKNRVGDLPPKRAQIPVPGGRLVFDLPEGWRLDEVEDDGEYRYYVVGDTQDWRRGAWLQLPSQYAEEPPAPIRDIQDILDSPLYEAYYSDISETANDSNLETLVTENGIGGNATAMILDNNRSRGVQLGRVFETLLVSGPLTQEKPYFGQDMVSLWEWMQLEPEAK